MVSCRDSAKRYGVSHTQPSEVKLNSIQFLKAGLEDRYKCSDTSFENVTYFQIPAKVICLGKFDVLPILIPDTHPETNVDQLEVKLKDSVLAMG